MLWKCVKFQIARLNRSEILNYYENISRQGCCLKTQRHTNRNWISIDAFICEIKLYCRDSKSINTSMWYSIMENILRFNNIISIVTSSLMGHVTSITSAFVNNHYFLSFLNDLLTLMFSEKILLKECK